VFLYFEDNPIATTLAFVALASVCVLVYVVRRRKHK
jgi:hypothetical protein